MIRDTNTKNRRIVNQRVRNNQLDACLGIGLGSAALTFGSHMPFVSSGLLYLPPFFRFVVLVP